MDHRASKHLKRIGHFEIMQGKFKPKRKVVPAARKRQNPSVTKQALFKLKCNRGQAFTEYVIAGCVFVTLVLALGVFVGRIQEGIFVEHALDSASHSASSNAMGTIGDILLY